jgi:hypothetical protein
VFPQFAERDATGFLQQDAEEAWGQIVYTLNEKLPGLTLGGELHATKKFVEQFMTVETTATYIIIGLFLWGESFFFLRGPYLK